MNDGYIVQTTIQKENIILNKNGRWRCSIAILRCPKVRITPDQSVMHCWGQRSYKGNKVLTRAKGNCPEMPKTTICGHCCFRLTPINTNKLARNIIDYFVIELLMFICTLVIKNKHQQPKMQSALRPRKKNPVLRAKRFQKEVGRSAHFFFNCFLHFFA